MAQQPAKPPTISPEQRARLEAVLVEFDRRWTPEAFDRFVPSTEGDEPLPPALTDFVRVDLEHHWSRGHEVHVEEYLAKFPALRQLPDALVDMLHGEHQAREGADRPLGIDELRRRFPTVADLVRQRIDQTPVSRHRAGNETNAQASIDTSHNDRDTQGGAPSPAPLPEQFGRYQILRQLGAGAMGAVYLAYDTQLDRQVALKTPSLGDGSVASELVERFYREARAAANLRHQNICPVHDVGQILGVHYISMAYIEGRPLSDYLRSEKKIPQRTAAVIVRKLARALAVAHRQGIVHRDLKPANVMVDERGEPVLTDFGLARRSTGQDSTMTRSGAIMGTPAYMSPEQAEAKTDAVGPAADQYALGVMLYEMLCGELPFNGSVAAVIGQVMTKSPQPPSEIRADLAPELERICMKMMAKSPTHRYASIEHVDAALGKWLKSPTAEKPQTDGAADQMTPSSHSHDAPAPMPRISPISVEATQSLGPPRSPRATRGRVISGRRLIVAATGGLLLLLAITLLIRTPQGTLSVVVSDPQLQVLVDGQTIQIKDKRWEGKRKASQHRLALRLGSTAIPFNETSGRFVAQDGRIRITVDDVELAGNRFAVARRGATVLKIELLPEAAPAVARGPDGLPGGPSVLAPWGSAKPRLIRRVDHRASLTRRTYFAALGPDGSRLAHRLEHETPLRFFRQTDPAPINVPTELQSATAMDYGGNGAMFATAHPDGTVRLWNSQTMKRIGQPLLTDASQLLQWISLSADGQTLLAVTGNPAILYAWDLNGRSQIIEPPALDVNVRKSEFAATADGRTLVVADSLGSANSIRVWDLPSGKVRPTEYLPEDGKPRIVLDVDITPDGERLAVGCKRGAAIVFDAASGKELWSGSHGGRVSSIQFSPNGQLLATCGAPHGSEDLHLWDLSTGKEWVRWHHPTDASLRSERLGAWITTLQFSRNGSRLLTAGSNTPICVWSLDREETIQSPVVTQPAPLPANGDQGDRAVAEKIIALGGSVGPIGPGGVHVHRLPRLPAGKIVISYVALYGANEQLQDEHLRLLAELDDLEFVGLGRASKLTLAGYQTLAACRGLDELRFYGSTLDDEALAELTVLPLDALTLWHTQVTNQGLQALTKLSILRELTVGSSRKTHKYGPAAIDDAGLTHLAKLDKLVKLEIYGPKFSDAAVEHVARCTQLRSLTIGASALSDEAIAELKRRLPDCKIIDKRREDVDELEESNEAEQTDEAEGE